MLHTFQIDDSTNKAKALLEFLRTLEFVKETDADWADTLPEEVINGIREGMKQVENGQTIPHSEMKAKHQKQFPHLNL